MNRLILALAALLALAPASAHAQSAPGWISYGYTPTAGQFRAAFTAKQDLLNYTPLSQTGGTMSGKLNTAPATVNGSGFAFLPGVAPTSPANGDAWVTSAGFFVRVNGQTSAVLPVGTTAGTVAAGNDSRIVGAVPSTRQILPGTGLTGGGDLSADRTLALGTTAVTAGSYTNANLTVDAYGRLTAASNGAGATVTVLPLGQARLSYSSATALLLKPYQGNQIWVNGAFRTIPTAGVSLANTGLTAATLYYVYAYMNGATLTLEAVTTTHAADTTYGHEIKSSDATRTLVGMAYTASGSPGTFADSTTQRFVASWFNRQGKTLEASISGVTSTATTAVANAALTLQYLTWSDEAVQANVLGTNTNGTVGSYSQTQLMIDGTAVGTSAAYQVSTAGYFGGVGLSRNATVSEGMHSAGVALFTNNGNQGTWSLNHTVGIRQ